MAKTESAPRVVVCDAGPLIHLAEPGGLDLLSDFAQVLVPRTVWGEVARHRPDALTCPDVSLEQATAVTPLPATLVALGRLFVLQQGELEALQLAQEQHADLLLSDDTAARLAARHVGLPVHGTIGILLRAIRRGQRTKDEVVVTLRSLHTVSTLHLKQTLLEHILRQVEQGP